MIPDTNNKYIAKEITNELMQNYGQCHRLASG